MAAPPSPASVPDGIVKGRPAASGGARRHTRRPAAWWLVAALLAAATLYGFQLQPPRPDPFAAPLPLVSLDWWLYPMPHRAMTAAEDIPVGTRGAFLPRRMAERVNAEARQRRARIIDAVLDTPEHFYALIDDPQQRGVDGANRGLTSVVEFTGGNVKVTGLTAGCTRVLIMGNQSAPVAFGCPGGTPDEEVEATAANASGAFALVRRFTSAVAPQKPEAKNLAAQQGPVQHTAGRPAGVAIGFTGGSKFFNFFGEWKVLAEQPEFGALDDLAVAADDSFGVAVGNDGVAFLFDRTGKVTRASLPFNSRLTSVHIAADGSVWTTSAADDAGRRTVLASFDHGAQWSVLDQRHSPAPWVTYLAVPLFLFALGGGVRAAILRGREADAGTPYVADIPTNDSPIGLKDHDSLNFRPIARALELFIRNINTEPPIIIAVTGEWGSGKSSLMNLTKELLERGGARPVWFNAWHHQDEESLLAALLENTREQAIPRFWTWPGLSFRLRLLRRRLVRELRWVVAFAVLVGALVFLLAVGGYRNLSDIGAARGWIDYLGNPDLLAAPVILAAPIFAIRLLRLLKVFPDSAAAILTELRRPKAGDIRDKLNFRYRFAREFEETADVLRTPLNPGMVIFIDDLDRCQPANVIEILEAVNFISGAGKCVIVLGMSKRMVSRAIWRAHEELFKDEWGLTSETSTEADRVALQQKHRAFSENYLEKLINIELALPVPSAEQSQALLAPSPAPPPWQGWAARIRAAMDWVYDLGPSLVAACLLLLALYFTPPPPVAAPAPAAGPAATATSPAAAPRAGTAESGASPSIAAPAPAPATPVRLPSPELLAAKYADHNWAAQIAIALVSMLLVGTVAVRYLIMASRPKVSDTPDFDEALRLWAPVVREERPTPRFLKRYKNRVRYFAMRMRPIPEEMHPAERFARWLFRPRGTEEEAAPDPAASDGGSVSEANIVALTALRVVDPSFVAPGEQSITDRLREVTVPANDDPRRAVLNAIEEALEAHQFRFGSLEDDRHRFNDVDPQDGEETEGDEAGARNQAVESSVKAA